MLSALKRTLHTGEGAGEGWGREGRRGGERIRKLLLNPRLCMSQARGFAPLSAYFYLSLTTLSTFIIPVLWKRNLRFGKIISMYPMSHWHYGRVSIPRSVCLPSASQLGYSFPWQEKYTGHDYLRESLLDPECPQVPLRTYPRSRLPCWPWHISLFTKEGFLLPCAGS